MKNIKIKFEPNLPVVRKFKEYGAQTGDESNIGKNYKHKKLVVEFIKEPITKPFDPDFFSASFDTRSEPYAEILLRSFMSKLRGGIPIPKHEATYLADALERILKNGKCSKFLYGPKEGAGRPPTDMFTEFMVLLMVEKEYQEIGRYESSRYGLGAYESARDYLQKQSMVLEVDAVRRIRREVIRKASRNADYLTQLLHFLRGFGYKPQFT